MLISSTGQREVNPVLFKYSVCNLKGCFIDKLWLVYIHTGWCVLYSMVFACFLLHWFIYHQCSLSGIYISGGHHDFWGVLLFLQIECILYENTYLTFLYYWLFDYSCWCIILYNCDVLFCSYSGYRTFLLQLLVYNSL